MKKGLPRSDAPCVLKRRREARCKPDADGLLRLSERVASSQQIEPGAVSFRTAPIADGTALSSPRVRTATATMFPADRLIWSPRPAARSTSPVPLFVGFCARTTRSRRLTGRDATQPNRPSLLRRPQLGGRCFPSQALETVRDAKCCATRSSNRSRVRDRALGSAGDGGSGTNDTA
jgi:hypothetical protein